MKRKRRPPQKLDKDAGLAIERLPAIQRLDAIALEMFGPPAKPQTPAVFGIPITTLNHNAEVARLIGTTPRSMRKYRATGMLPEQLLARLTLEWRLWRRRETDARENARRAKQKAAKAARLRAIHEHGIDALRLRTPR